MHKLDVTCACFIFLAPGCGKSTLLRLIMGVEKPISGRVALGQHNIHPNYFEQNQAEALDAKETVIGTLVKAVSHY